MLCWFHVYHKVIQLYKYIYIYRYACVLSHFSHIRLFATQWTVAHQAPLSMGLSRQEYWSGLHALLQGIFLTQGLNWCLLCLLH